MILIMMIHQSIGIKLMKTCKNCRCSYIISDNNISACKVHKGRFIGAEARLVTSPPSIESTSQISTSQISTSPLSK